jgi:hypothetical protein|tara:strand:- start:1039 stop:1242 length:204 start_codon:yes stop_codon:yes gene_type:complete
MTRQNKAKKFSEQAEKNRLKISVKDAEEIGGYGTVVTAAYSVIRKRDASDFEPAAVFVPTPSHKEFE